MTFQPYQSPRVRPPSIDSQDNRLFEIQQRLNRYSNGSIENLATSYSLVSPPVTSNTNEASQAKQSAANHITRVISRRISKENRSGSQPNLTQIPDHDIGSAPLSPRIIQE